MNRDGSQELFARWQKVAREEKKEIALHDSARGEQWTFGELLRASEQGNSAGAVEFPAGNGPEFILACLRAWRQGRTTCPVETAQKPPALTGLPRNYAHVKVTSASTGAAKCIAFTASQLAADATNICSSMGLRKEWPNLACISLSHSYGFSNLVLPLTLHGIPLVLVAAPLPEMIFQAAQKWSGLALPAVPALWRSWHESRHFPKNLKLAISAGAPLPLELERAIFETHGLKVHNFYGSSECGGIAYDRSAAPRADAGFVGSALDNVSLSTSNSGTLIVQSAAVADSYWPVPGSALGDGRFETTDLVELTGGDVYLRGRLTDLINVAGRKVSPEVIEVAIKTHPLVRECVVFGRAEGNDARFDTIVACVHPQTRVSVPEMAQFLSAQLPGWQIPRQWWFTQELLPNARGKISRAEWRAKYETVLAAKRAESGTS